MARYIYWTCLFSQLYFIPIVTGYFYHVFWTIHSREMSHNCVVGSCKEWLPPRNGITAVQLVSVNNRAVSLPCSWSQCHMLWYMYLNSVSRYNVTSCLAMLQMKWPASPSILLLVSHRTRKRGKSRSGSYRGWGGVLTWSMIGGFPAGGGRMLTWSMIGGLPGITVLQKGTGRLLVHVLWSSWKSLDHKGAQRTVGSTLPCHVYHD